MFSKRHSEPDPQLISLSGTHGDPCPAFGGGSAASKLCPTGFAASSAACERGERDSFAGDDNTKKSAHAACEAAKSQSNAFLRGASGSSAGLGSKFRGLAAVA